MTRKGAPTIPQANTPPDFDTMVESYRQRKARGLSTKRPAPDDLLTEFFNDSVGPTLGNLLVAGIHFALAMAEQDPATSARMWEMMKNGSPPDDKCIPPEDWMDCAIESMQNLFTLCDRLDAEGI